MTKVVEEIHELYEHYKPVGNFIKELSLELFEMMMDYLVSEAKKYEAERMERKRKREMLERNRLKHIRSTRSPTTKNSRKYFRIER